MDLPNIIGCFVSRSSLKYDATEKEKEIAKEQDNLFHGYIFGENGISHRMKKLKHEDYGQDVEMILFQFYTNPIPYLLQSLKEIENYRRKEKSIGIPIIVNDENFFNNSETDRYAFLKQSIFNKLDLLSEIIKKKKLDTHINQLMADLSSIL